MELPILWKKETFKDQLMYVDLFDKVKDDETLEDLRIKSFRKSDKKSAECRELGNAVYAVKNWSEAMEYYNQSLRYAKPDTENVALAYANR